MCIYIYILDITYIYIYICNMPGGIGINVWFGSARRTRFPGSKWFGLRFSEA